MPLFNEKNIAGISFACSVVLVVFLTVATGAMFIVTKIRTLDDDLVVFEQEFFAQQRDQLKNDVVEVLTGIDVRRDTALQMIEEQLRNRVEEVSLMAGNLHRNLQGRMAEPDIAALIRESIRPIRLNDRQGYFFILTLAGESILYPADTDIEGANFLNEFVGGGSDIVERLIAIAEEKGRGFLRYGWPKPGDDSGALFHKISYVTFFEPFGWVIGTGEYLENLEALARDNLVRELGGILPTDSTDYYFIYELHNIEGGKDFATMLINGNRPDLVGQKISDDYQDAQGKQFRKEFMEGIRRNNEAFVVYWYRKPGGSGEGRKLSYFRFYPEWNWIVARGIYLDRMDAIVAEKKEVLRQKVGNDILLLGMILLIGIGLALLIAYSLSRGLQRIFDRYHRNQQENLEKLAALNTTLERQGRIDPLTGVYNRRYFNSRLAEEIARCNRFRTPLSLIMFDIDDFKLINDRIGHLAGDAVLKEISQLVRDNIRQTDLLARWGGEEFVILVPGVDLPGACRAAEKLRRLVEKHRFSEAAQLTCSFGVSDYQPAEVSQGFIERADQAMYRAKEEGRNRCVSPLLIPLPRTIA